MEAREAIEVLTDKNTSIGTLKCDDKAWRKLKPAIDTAVEALKKQIPSEPIRKSWELPRCPSCGAALGEWLGDGYTRDWESKKVCDCGQKIKWHDDI